jgi:CubicO group peptidase (beta-lactamase class C family)
VKTTVLAVLSIALIIAPAAAQQPAFGLPADPLEDFDAYVRQALEDWGGVGLAVAIVKDGEVVFQEGYGVRSLDTGEPMTPETMSGIASTTKAMTAAAVGMLVDEGKLGWDDRVIDHLTWFRLADPVATREVTVRDLLTHRGGLPRTGFLWVEQETDTREILERLRLVEPAYPLRGGYAYQNVMYAAAGELTAEVSGMPWTEFIRTRIFEPLGMDRSVPTLAEAMEQRNVTSPHDEVDGELRVIEHVSADQIHAAGSVWSTVADMSRWLAFLLRGCETEAGEALLEPATCAELFEPQTLVPPSEFYPTHRVTKPHWMSYGLGWFQHDYEGRKVDFHTGSLSGIVAIAGVIRDEGLGVYLLANRDHLELRHALMYRVFDLYDADPPRDWSAELRTLYDRLAARADSARAAAEAKRMEGTSPTLPIERYAGTYSDPLAGTVEVTRGENGLRVRYGLREGTLEHWHYDTFQVRWDKPWRVGMPVTFRLGPDATVASLDVPGAVLRRQD